MAVPHRRNLVGPTYIREEVPMLSMSEAASATGVAPHRIKYALITGLLKEPAKAGGRRCFTPEDVDRIRRHFATASKGPVAHPGHEGGNASS